MPHKSITGFNLHGALKSNQQHNSIYLWHREELSPAASKMDRPGEIFEHLNIQFIADKHLWVVSLKCPHLITSRYCSLFPISLTEHFKILNLQRYP